MLSYLISKGLEFLLVIPAIILFNLGAFFILFILVKFVKGDI